MSLNCRETRICTFSLRPSCRYPQCGCWQMLHCDCMQVAAIVIMLHSDCMLMDVPAIHQCTHRYYLYPLYMAFAITGICNMRTGMEWNAQLYFEKPSY